MKKAFFGTSAIRGLFTRVITRYQYILLCIITISLGASCSNLSSEEKRLPFIVSIHGNDTIQNNYIVLDCQQIADRMGGVDLSERKIRVRDLDNDDILIPQLVDVNNDTKPDFVKIETNIQSEEPIRPFELILTKEKPEEIKFIEGPITNRGTIQVRYLRSFSDYSVNNNLDGKWAKTISKTFTDTYPNPFNLEIFEPGEWTYTNGFFLNGLCYSDQLTGEDNYLLYVQKWLDFFVNEKGKIDSSKYSKERYRLDDILPGRSLLYIYQKTGDSRYLKAAGTLIGQLKSQPRTSTGGYWHKKIYDWQMWLDGIYMSDVFLLQYADLTNQPEYIDEALFQMKLVYKNTRDTATGLLAHGWDESRSKIWADPVSGKSPEFWGRGMGWYIMALADALDYISPSHPQRGEVLAIFKNISGALLNYQDEESGLWYQVLDKSKEKGNWPESSCTAMFAYAFLKGYKMGYLPEKFRISAAKAYEGLKQHFIYFDDDGKIYLTGTVRVGTLNEEVSNGSYDYYISVERRINDFKGVGALLYLAIVDEQFTKQNPDNDEK